VVHALARRKKPILFIDEIHARWALAPRRAHARPRHAHEAGAQRRRPARGGFTTFEEFKQIEKDRALARRLQKVVIDEPTVEEAGRILQGLRSRYEAHHGVRYSDEAIDAAVKLAKRHLRDSRLPDSAIDILDEAGAMVRLAASQALMPAPGEAAEEAAPVAATGPRCARPGAGRRGGRLAGRTAAGAGVRPNPPRRNPRRGRHRRAHRRANGADSGEAGERLRPHAAADARGVVARVVFGQDEAVHVVSQAINVRAPGWPAGPAGRCFLFTGPTAWADGAGKQLALHLGNEFIRYDMSEYMEKHAVARLIGAPPGYVGFEQGGLLVDAVQPAPVRRAAARRDREGAPRHLQHPAQVMDHATLTDNNGGRRTSGRWCSS